MACAYQRAAGVMATAARNLHPGRVEDRIKTLIESDRYAVRAQLVAVFAEDGKGRRLAVLKFVRA